MRLLNILVFTVLAACSASGQSDTTTPAPAGGAEPAISTTCPTAVGATVLSTSFTASGERAPIVFQAGCLYWATTDVGGILLQLRPRRAGTQLPYLGQLMSGGVQGGSTWEIRATIDGEYNIWVTGAPSGRAVKLSVTVRGNSAPKSK